MRVVKLVVRLVARLAVADARTAEVVDKLFLLVVVEEDEDRIAALVSRAESTTELAVP
jgi:hypothetical protein